VVQPSRGKRKYTKMSASTKGKSRATKTAAVAANAPTGRGRGRPKGRGGRGQARGRGQAQRRGQRTSPRSTRVGSPPSPPARVAAQGKTPTLANSKAAISTSARTTRAKNGASVAKRISPRKTRNGGAAQKDGCILS
jgi:hypothetical protein